MKERWSAAAAKEWWNSDGAKKWRSGEAPKEWWNGLGAQAQRLAVVSAVVAAALAVVVVADDGEEPPVNEGLASTAAASVTRVDPMAAEEPTPEPFEVTEVTLATEGDVDETVAATQFLLNCTGYGDLVVDGIFGPATLGAVEAAQDGLGRTVTGEIDDAAFAELSRECSLSRRVSAGPVSGNAAAGDPEVYVLTLAEGSELSVDVTNGDGVTIAVYGPSSSVVAPGEDGIWTVTADGDHQIEVSAADDAVTFTIDVSVEVPRSDDDGSRRRGPHRGPRT